ncbi:mycofactocin-coupled SDR family oxidoreductase [Amycolatopsis pithecellobii]|uniref:Mycofactocin-coupled SDR family oxidoreductase n=1 Tax=Amycolatopsis pithecellobii TaxID=664692 RepID=A0A6N7Z257_9PSEU|nr:mycofactocin-coupled SDR family oxidoreductase [Amycolatopsis pithecellobii]MTD55653.1 mycofactocin-coupled SDR family oxidoreductase [Amycolatopsis pithecellobii]
MGRLDGKIAFITGAGRGQGRSHAVRLAAEGAGIIAVDICADVETAPYALSSSDDLAETERLVTAAGGRIVTRPADVRDSAQLASALSAGLDEFGRLDVVCAGAGIFTRPRLTWEMSDDEWQQTIDVNLTGVWRTVKATVPFMIEQGTGGSIVITSSSAGFHGFPHFSQYAAAKRGLVGLMQSLVRELSPHRIRVNTVHPSGVDTPMIHFEELYRLFLPGEDDPTREQFAEAFRRNHPLGIPWLEPIDISNAVLWLASEESRYVTGVQLPVDAGFGEN